MKAIEVELKRLERERDKSEANIASANETLGNTQHSLTDARARRNEITARMTPLQRLISELSSIQAASDKQRQAAAPDIEEAEKFHTELLAKLEKELPKSSRNAIEKAIKAIDTAIDELKKSVNELALKVDNAVEAVARARTEAMQQDRDFREKLAQLRSLTTNLQTDRKKLATLTGAAKAATENGRLNEAYYLAQDLRQTLNTLKKQLDADMETQLEGELDKYWVKAGEARVELAKNTAALAELNRERSSKAGELQRKVQQREADIRAALTAQAKEQPPRRRARS